MCQVLGNVWKVKTYFTFLVAIAGAGIEGETLVYGLVERRVSRTLYVQARRARVSFV